MHGMRHEIKYVTKKRFFIFNAVQCDGFIDL